MVTAGRRFGKTHLALVSLLLEALSHPKCYLWYVAPTFRQAKMVSWRKLKELTEEFQAGIKFNEAELSVTLVNGSVIELKGAENEDALRGAGLGCKTHKGGLGLVIDEFASIYDNWDVWHEVLRPMLADNDSGALFIGTPKGKDSFYDLYLKGERKELDWESWQFKSTDNLALDLAKDAAEAKRDTPERYYRQEWEASFEDYEGLVYPEFSEKLHVVEPFYIPRNFPRVGSIDPATSGTTAVIKAAIDDDGRIIVYDEYYEEDKRASEVAKRIKDKRFSWVMDPAAKGAKVEREGKLIDLFTIYRDHGIYAREGENSVDAGINAVGEMFKTGRIKIFKNCEKLIWELERYHWTQPKEGAAGIAKPKPFKKNDHLCDALRYLVMTRPDAADIDLKLDDIPYDSAWAVSQRLKKKSQKKEFHYHARR